MRNSVEKFPVEKLEQAIGYTFRNKELLIRAFTHSSFANEMHIAKQDCNERLEFLGDAVLEMVSSLFLYERYPNKREGELTKFRASLVCEPSLAKCAAELDLGSYLLLSHGEDMGGGRERDSITSDALEALIGAIYLDAGYEEAAAFIHKFVLSDPEKRKLFYDSKTVLQEMIQAQGKGALHYILTGEEGPAHNKKFYVQALLDETVVGEGSGRTKKAAEQMAAYEAIMKLKESK